MLLAGGYAAPQGGPGSRDRALRPLRQALHTLLAAHDPDPDPAIVVDARWDLVTADAAADRHARGLPGRRRGRPGPGDVPPR